jgi:hypothetical protein
VLTCGCRPLEFAGAVAEKKAGDPAELVLDSGFVVPDANAFGNTFRSLPQFILLDRVRVFRGLATRNRSGRQQHAGFIFLGCFRACWKRKEIRHLLENATILLKNP